MIQRTMSIQNKVEVTSQQNVRHTFASKVAFLFRELPDYIEDVGTEGYLFKSAVIRLHLQLLVVFANVWEVKWVVRKNCFI